MPRTFERRLAVLESADPGALALRVIPEAVATEPATLAMWTAREEAQLPPGTRLLAVRTGVVRGGE